MAEASRWAESDRLNTFKSEMPLCKEWTEAECMHNAKLGFQTAVRIYCVLNYAVWVKQRCPLELAAIKQAKTFRLRLWGYRTCVLMLSRAIWIFWMST